MIYSIYQYSIQKKKNQPTGIIFKGAIHQTILDIESKSLAKLIFDCSLYPEFTGL